MKSSAFVFLASLVITATASAQDIKTKKSWDKIDEVNKAAVANVKEKCGSDLTIKLDQKSFTTPEQIEGPGRWCARVADTMAGLCASDADYKSGIAKKVKTLQCVYDPSLTSEGSKDQYGNKFSFKNGVFESRYNDKTANQDEYVQKFLKDTL